MFIREARAAGGAGVAAPTPLLVVLALLLGTAYAAELVADRPVGFPPHHRRRARADPAAGLGHDRATATSPHATRETHRSGVRIGATLALGAVPLLAWATRRTRRPPVTRLACAARLRPAAWASGPPTDLTNRFVGRRHSRSPVSQRE